MPRKGYRKGVSDKSRPVSRFVRTRVTDDEYALLAQEAALRTLTHSKFVRAVLVGHIKNHRSSLPKASGRHDELLRQLSRVGNNLNQLTRQANAGLVPVTPGELRACLATLAQMAQEL